MWYIEKNVTNRESILISPSQASNAQAREGEEIQPNGQESNRSPLLALRAPPTMAFAISLFPNLWKTKEAGNNISQL